MRWFKSRLSSILPVAILILMGVSLTWQAVVWLRQANAPLAATATPIAETVAALDIQQILPLFGSSAALGQTAAPATNLRLTLLGSFVHVDPKRSSAIIQSEGSTAKRYSSNTEISAGVYLHAVYRDRIELKRNGRLETLAFSQYPQGLDDLNRSSSMAEEFSQPKESESEIDAQERERMEALGQQIEPIDEQPVSLEPEPNLEEN